MLRLIPEPDYLLLKAVLMAYPNDQGNPAGAIPVYVTKSSGVPGTATPMGFKQLALTGEMHISPVPGATFAVIQCQGQDARWRDDGVAPTATVGMLLSAGFELEYNGPLAALDFIGATTGSVLNISFYK